MRAVPPLLDGGSLSQPCVRVKVPRGAASAEAVGGTHWQWSTAAAGRQPEHQQQHQRQHLPAAAAAPPSGVPSSETSSSWTASAHVKALLARLRVRCGPGNSREQAFEQQSHVHLTTLRSSHHDERRPRSARHRVRDGTGKLPTELELPGRGSIRAASGRRTAEASA